MACRGEGNGTPLQYSCLENPMEGGAWWATVHGVAESRTQLSDFTFTFHFHALEKEMATHSSVLAWRIPGMGEPNGLLSMGSHRVGHDWSDLAAAAVWLVGFYFQECFALVVSDSVWPHGLSPTRLLRPWILQARILEWAAICYTRGSSPNQGSNPCLLCLLNWQASSLPLAPRYFSDWGSNLWPCSGSMRPNHCISLKQLFKVYIIHRYRQH